MSFKNIRNLLKESEQVEVSGINSDIDPGVLSNSRWFKTYRRGGSYGNSASKEYMDDSDAGLSEDIQSQPYSSEHKWRSHVQSRHGYGVEYIHDKSTGETISKKSGHEVGRFKYNNASPNDVSGDGSVRISPVIDKKEPVLAETSTLGSLIKEYQVSKDNLLYGKSKDERAKLAVYKFFEGLENADSTSIDEEFETVTPDLLDEVAKAALKMIVKKAVKKSIEKQIE